MILVHGRYGMPKKTILLVEDNPDDLELALLALRNGDVRCDIAVAQDGQEALDFLLSDLTLTKAMPSVVLLDLKLPLVDGFEVLRQLRYHAATCFLPVVILSSSKEECDLATCYELGANSYIQKSQDFSIFTGLVSQVARYWLNMNEVPLACRI
jgi:two-component system, response regulator